MLHIKRANKIEVIIYSYKAYFLNVIDIINKKLV